MVPFFKFFFSRYFPESVCTAVYGVGYRLIIYSRLEPIVHLAQDARVMLTSNLWLEAGLVNGAMGTVKAICYKSGEPPQLPTAQLLSW